MVPFTENGESKELPMAQLIQRAMNKQALQGKTTAGFPMLKMLKEILEEEQSEQEDVFRLAVETKQRVTEYVKHREKLGRDFRFPIPHPDHIKLDWDEMTVSIVGPQDEDELHERLCVIAAMVQAEISIQEAELNGHAAGCEEIKSLREFLEKTRKQVRLDDPIWKEYAPGYRKQVIDCLYYAGERPDLPHKPAETPKSIKEAVREVSDQTEPAIKHAAQNLLAHEDSIRRYLREKLESLMGDEWETRLERKYHEPRDIEHDRMRCEYEMGTFDVDNYDFTDEEKEALKDPETLAEYMAW